MKNQRIQLYVVLILFFVKGYTMSSTYTSAVDSLLNALTLNYDVRIRPDTVVPISVSLSVTSFNYLDLDTGIFSVTARFSMSWYDAVYRWSPGASNVEYMFLSNSDCWRPELFILNAASDMFSDRDQRMRVYHDGQVLWETSGDVTVPCEVDTSSEKHVCSIGLSSLYTTSEVPLTHYAENVDMDIPVHPGWNILDTSTHYNVTLDGRKAFSRSYLSFQFQLEQKHSWFSVVVYLLVSCLGSIVFLLPVHKGERISFLCTILLTVTVTFLYIRMYEKYFTLGLFLLFLLISNILQLLMTLIVLRIHENEQYDRPVPSGIQTFTRKVLVRFSCYCCCRPKSTDDDYDKRMSPLKFPMPKNTRVSPSAVARQRGQNDFDRIRSGASTRTTAEIFASTSSTSESASSMTNLLEEEYSWVEIAGMLDRIFLILSLLVFICVTSVFVPILYVSK